ncbi:hypothetical protein Ancab_032679 [Ancistrocladus abbreviatus]
MEGNMQIAIPVKCFLECKNKERADCQVIYGLTSAIRNTSICSKMSQDQIFEHRWDFRRNDGDMDSSHNDSGSSSGSDPKLKKHNLVDSFISAENEESTRHPRKENETSFERANKWDNQPQGNHTLVGDGMHGRASSKAKVKRNKRSAYDYDFAAGLNSLQAYMGTLLEELKVAREDMFKWMGEEMDRLVANGAPPPKPTRRRKVPRQERKGSPNEKRSRLGVRTQNRKTGSSEKSGRGKKAGNANNSDKGAEEQAVGGGEAVGSLASTATALTATGTVKLSVTTPVASDKKERAKPSGLSIKKPRFSSDQLDKASTSNYLTLPTILPPSEAENTAPNHPSSCTNIQASSPPVSKMNGNKTVPTSTMDLSTCQGYFPRVQQEGRILPQTGLNMGCFDQNRNPLMSTGSGFPVPLYHGLSGGFGIANSSRLGGFEYLTQSSSMPPSMRMNGGSMRFSGGSHELARQQGDNNHLKYTNDGGLGTFRTP